MKKMLFVSIFATFLTFCNPNNSTITGPSIPDVPADPILGPALEPFNPGPAIDLRSMDGFSAFAICGRDERTQRQVWSSARNHGYHYGRVLSQSSGWANNPVFARVAGQKIFYKNGKVVNKGALAEFKECLRIAAEEGMGMLVMGITTPLRQSGTDAKREAWLRAIGKAAEPYDNIAWEVANEYWHPRSAINRPDFLNRMQRVLRTATQGQRVGADQNLGSKFSNTARYRYDYRVRSDFPSFHPWRNPDPTAADIRDIVRENGGWVLLSETTSYTNDPADLATFGWLVTTDRNQIQTYMNRCQPREGCSFVFHSIDGLFTEGRFSWMPQRQS